MKRNGNISGSSVFLRKKAEELLNKQRLKPGSQLSAPDGLKLIHELEVHQIELEMQNEELILSRSAAIDSAEALALKNEELIRLNAEKDKFFSILAHDLRNPLSSFLGLTKIFSEELSEMKQEEVQELANSLRESAKSVYHLLENLLDWSQMQRGLIEFKPVKVHLNDIIKKTIGSLSDLANQKNQEVQLQLSGNPFVRVDLTMLESTLRNLLSNALKFSFRGGHITLSTNVLQDKFMEIAVIDNGLGMSAGLISRLFTLDGRTGRIGTEGEHSTGLGLLLCKEFVEKNGGEIVAVSVEGKGSTFSFTLPIYTDPS
jgi:signal transduction histidine kinase